MSTPDSPSPSSTPTQTSPDQQAARRGFLKGAGLVIAGSLLPGTSVSADATPAAATAPPLTEKEKLARIATNTYPMRQLFKRRPMRAGGGGMAGSSAAARMRQEAEELKKKYGEITLLDFAQFTRDHFPGVTKMDLWSSLFGDVTDDSMYIESPLPPAPDGRPRSTFEFDPSSASGRKWLEQLASRAAQAGVQCHHVSNNAPRNISDPDAEARRHGIEVAKKWLDACAIIGAKTMRVNTGGPRIVPQATTAGGGYPKNDEIVKLIANAIESFREMADYGGKVGVKVTIENHWGLSADPMVVRIILDEVNHPFCEASPDFCNWEHEYMLYHGLKALAPYSHTTAHAKYWDRWKSVDIPRCVRIMTEGGFKGVFALEYEDGPWNGVEGAQYLMKEVLKGL
ncbi:MAG TPA: TIM barrel protein [Vicinamibacterales bacterium]